MKSIYRFKVKDIGISTRKKTPLCGAFSFRPGGKRRLPHRGPAALEAAGGDDRLCTGHHTAAGERRGRVDGLGLLGLRTLLRVGLSRLLRLGLRLRRLRPGFLPRLGSGLGLGRGLGRRRRRRGAHRRWVSGRGCVSSPLPPPNNREKKFPEPGRADALATTVLSAAGWGSRGGSE